MNSTRVRRFVSRLRASRLEEESDLEEDWHVQFLVPIETAEKIRVSCKKELARCFTPCMGCGVPDSPDTDKEILGVRIERTLKLRVARAAAAEGITITEFVRRLLVSATATITLTSSDYAKIAAQVEKAERRLKQGR